MASFTRLAALAALLASTVSNVAAVGTSGQGTTTRYWDCCKPSCAWSKPGMTSPVKTCDINDQPLADGVTAQSGCNGGTSFMCSSQSPWAIDDNLAYGFAAVTSSSPNCCSCYKLTFTGDSPIKGKTMIVQATNTGDDVGHTQFDIAMPGGGFGLFDACTREWKASPAVWGAQYGGSSTNQCASMPAALQSGCGFRWDWMRGVSNPTVDYEQVTCPSALVAKSGCSVTGYVSGGNPTTVTAQDTGSARTTSTAQAQAPTTTTTAAVASIKASNTTESYPSAAGGSSGGGGAAVVDDANSSATDGTGAATGASGEGVAAVPSTGNSTTTTAAAAAGEGTTGGTEEQGADDNTCEP
ncbi:MAG: hypothetical protein Q9173_007081 [Seirophora scorigena]